MNKEREFSSKFALVTGATGFLGAALCKELLENGYRVRALHRSTSDVKSLRDLPGLELFEGDVTDKDSLRGAMRGVDFVFHIAALFRQAKFPDEVYWKVNVEGTRNVLDLVEELGVKKLIHCSTIGVHSHIPNPPANEDEEFRPGDIYQESKAEGEKLVHRYVSDGRVQAVVVRPAMIWGPGDTRTLKLFRGIAKRSIPLIGSGKTLTHWVLVSDLARGFRLSAENASNNGRTYIFAGERPVPMAQVFEAIGKAIKVRPLPFRIPAWPIRALGAVVEAVCVPLGIEPPIYRRRVDFFTKTRAFDCTRAREELGYKPRYSFEEEVDYIANWYKSHGWI